MDELNTIKIELSDIKKICHKEFFWMKKKNCLKRVGKMKKKENLYPAWKKKIWIYKF